MSAIQITTQSLGYVLSSEADYTALLFSALGSFFAAGAVALYTQWSLKKRDDRLKTEEAAKEKRRIESLTNCYTEMVFGNLCDFINLIEMGEEEYPQTTITDRVSHSTELLIAISHVAPTSLIHLFSFLDSLEKINAWLKSNRDSPEKYRPKEMVKSGFANLFLTLAYLQQTEEYNITIKERPIIYFTDKIYKLISQDYFFSDIKQSIEAISPKYTISYDRLLSNYHNCREQILKEAITPKQ